MSYQANDSNDWDVLSPELRKSLGDAGGANPAVVLPSSKPKIFGKSKKKRQRMQEEAQKARMPARCAEPIQRPQNAIPSRKKSQRGAEEALDVKRSVKKMKAAEAKVARDRELKERRAVLFERLKKHQIANEAQKLLQSSSEVGRTKETAKSKLTHELRLERAGVLIAEQEAQGTETEQERQEKAASAIQARQLAKRHRATLRQQRSKASNAARASLAVSTTVFSSEDESSESEEDDNIHAVVRKNRPSVLTPQATIPTKTAATAPNTQTTCPSSAVTSVSDAQPIQKELSTTPAVVVRPVRPEAIQKSRMELPVCGMEQEIMEAIRGHPITVLCGDTGSGKTTQVPQFLLESGFGSGATSATTAATLPPKGYSTTQGIIAVTQPRRVAAISMAHRVASELGLKIGNNNRSMHNQPELQGAVGYQVRYDGKTVGSATRIKFMTDGVLLREAKEDLLLRRYSVIVLDEAHERNLNTDILLGVISRIVPLRAQILAEQQEQLRQQPGSIPTEALVEPLRVVIMSATLRVDDFVGNERLFQSSIAQALMSPPNRPAVVGVDGPYPPRVIKVQARQHAVTSHFARRTELLDYVGAAFKKTCSIHRKLPEGGILVFLTGQREIEWFCKSLRDKFNVQDRRKRKRVGMDGEEKKDGEVEEEENDETVFANMGESEEAGGEQEQQDDGNENNDDIENDSEEDDADNDGKVVLEDDEDVDYSDIDDTDDEANSDSDDDGDTRMKGKSKELSEEERHEELELVRATGSDATAAAASAAPFSNNNSNNSSNNNNNSTASKYGANCDLDPEPAAGKVHVLPLYSRLPPKEQMRVFAQVPKGHRLIVVATNVAETSITIPNVKYVVDCGREKVRSFDQYSNTSRFTVEWISQASGNQREGRAGRSGPGHSYRLYSSAVFHDHFSKFSDPEITRLPIDDLVLYMRSLGITDVEKFPFPTSPDDDALRVAALRLTSIGALSHADQSITEMGEKMAQLPVGARFAKVLVAAIASVVGLDRKHQLAMLRHVLALVAVQSVPTPFIDVQEEKKKERDDKNKSDNKDSDNEDEEEEELEEGEDVDMKKEEEEDESNRPFWHDTSSDALSLLKVAGAYLHTRAVSGLAAANRFCSKQGLHAKTMGEMFSLRQQLAREAAKILIDMELEQQNGSKSINNDLARSLADKMLMTPRPPTTAQGTGLRQALVSGLLDQVARKVEPTRAKAIMRQNRQPTLRKSWPYETCSATGPALVYVHPKSTVFTSNGRGLPSWVAYTEITETVRQLGRTAEQAATAAADPTKFHGGEGESITQHYMKGVTALDATWLWKLCQGTGSRCSPGKPSENPMPRFNAKNDRVVCCVQPTFGWRGFKLPTMWVGYEEVVDALSGGVAGGGVGGAAGGGDFVADDARREQARWFARELLNGKVEPMLSGLSEWLAVPSITLIKAKHQPRVDRLVGALAGGPGGGMASVCTIECLHGAWKRTQSQGYLRAELLAWVKSEHKLEFKAAWTAMIAKLQAGSN